MPRPGTSGGGHRSSGGHSSSRVGGGHHVGRSSRPTGSSSLTEVLYASLSSYSTTSSKRLLWI